MIVYIHDAGSRRGEVFNHPTALSDWYSRRQPTRPFWTLKPRWTEKLHTSHSAARGVPHTVLGPHSFQHHI